MIWFFVATYNKWENAVHADKCDGCEQVWLIERCVCTPTEVYLVPFSRHVCMVYRFVSFWKVESNWHFSKSTTPLFSCDVMWCDVLFLSYWIILSCWPIGCGAFVHFSSECCYTSVCDSEFRKTTRFIECPWFERFDWESLAGMQNLARRSGRHWAPLASIWWIFVRCGS